MCFARQSSGYTAKVNEIDPISRNLHQSRRKDLVNNEPYKIKTKANRQKNIISKSKGKKTVLIRKMKKATKQTLVFNL